MLRPVYDRRLNVLQRGAGGKFTDPVPGKANIPCMIAARSVRMAQGGGTRADVVSEMTLMWGPDVEISENSRVRIIAKRVAGKWQPATAEPLYVVIEGSVAAPEINGVISHHQAFVAKEAG